MLAWVVMGRAGAGPRADTRLQDRAKFDQHTAHDGDHAVHILFQPSPTRLSPGPSRMCLSALHNHSESCLSHPEPPGYARKTTPELQKKTQLVGSFLWVKCAIAGRVEGALSLTPGTGRPMGAWRGWLRCWVTGLQSEPMNNPAWGPG